MNKEKEYIEPEVLGKDEKSFSGRAAKAGTNFAGDKINDQIKDIKKTIFIKGGMMLLPYILGSLLFLGLFGWLLYVIFSHHPFDYILYAVIFLYLIKRIMK